MRLLSDFTVAFWVALRVVLAASTFTLGFALEVPSEPTLSITQDGSIGLPKSACAADVCQTNSQIINGEYKVCVTCCNEAGACRSFCH